MYLSKDLFVGIGFLALFIGYGLMAGDIATLPGDEYEVITARTLPKALAVIGGLLSFAFLITRLIAMKAPKTASASVIAFAWKRTFALLLVMTSYGLILDWLGFFISTVLFLIAGIAVMGERRPKVLFGVSLPFVLVIWVGLTQFLDVYLAPGKIFALIGG